MSSTSSTTQSASAQAPSCVLIGGESLLIQCGEVLLSAGWTIHRVVTKEDEILSWARKANLETCSPGKTLSHDLTGVEFDYLFSITNLSIIPEAVLSLARRGTVNFHDGPLPNYAGMYTPAWAILNGESEYGITFHEMTAGVDEGRILVQRRFPIAPDDTSLTLNTSCYAAAIEAFEELADGLSNDTLTPREQDLEGRSYFGRHERPNAAAVIDWNAQADEIVNAVRAMDFGARYQNAFAVAKLVHSGRVVCVRNARALEIDSKAAPGTVLAINESEWQIQCADGAIALSGFSCPRGRQWTSQEAAEALAVEEGQFLSGIADLPGLTALNQATTPSEAFWIRRLGSLDPIEAPYRRSRDRQEDPSQQIDASKRRVERVDFSLSAASGQQDGLHALVAFALYLGRIQGHSNFDLTWSDDALTMRIADYGELFSAHVPLRIDADARGSSSTATSSILKQIEKTREKGTFLIDVISRDPKLSGQAMLAAGDWTSVTLGLHEDVDQALLPKGSDLGFFVDTKGRRAQLAYDADALDAASIETIRNQMGVFFSALSHSDQPLAKVPFLKEQERDALLKDWNQTAVDFDRSATLRSLFEAQVEQTPEAIAVVFEGESLSYRELDERAGRLANYLRGKGIGPDQLVGLHLARSLEMVVGVIAVLKSGGAYVPLDPVYPADRIAYMIEDSKARVVLTHRASNAAPDQGLPDSLELNRIVDLDRDAEAIEAQPSAQPSSTDSETSPENLAYVIYTSGSTGQPKGVMVEHRNVVNFFVGMDERVAHDGPGVWLAVTSLSFDISVLELLWTLTRGFKVVVFLDHDRGAEATPAWRPLDMGIALWGSDAGPGPRKYELMLESAKFADERGFSAVHTPERHFGAFGGPFPNPSVTSAAIAAVTSRVRIRASSCVLPLHHPVRVAEEWAVVDNISNGRVEISFAAGWQPNDFVLRPEAFSTAKTAMFENAETVRKLWRGETVEFQNPLDQAVPVSTLPRPVQPELPCWITTAGNVETFREAGAKGYNVLSHLLGQTLPELAEKVRAYRTARKEAGLDPATGVVTCMLHTFVGDSDDEVRELVREPMKEYLASAMKLVMDFAWSFPAFERPGGPDSKPEDVDLSTLTHEETDAILEFAFYRYFETSGLFGTRETCEEMLQRVKDADINEVACLIDFGVDTDVVLQSLDALDDVRRATNEAPVTGTQVAESAPPTISYSFVEQVERHGITHLQCTPSHATMLLVQPDTRAAMSQIKNIMIGGEAFPVSLAAELDGVASDVVTNMYGPTETTIWSSTEPIKGRPETISIGTPIANTQLYILDASGEPLPIGIAGELLIGGEGVVRGYLERPELTAERFIPDPFSTRPDARLYRTGDLARWSPDGRIEFLGRLDHQVKIRGYRIELGEIEARLASHPGIRECVAIAREDTPGDIRLVAYAIAETEPVSEDSLKELLRESLPDFMVPAYIFFMERFPQTPNGKVDRKALPAPHELKTRSTAEFKAPENDLEKLIATAWKEVLYLDQVGANDNFFDLGGHSLLVVQAHRKLAEVCPMPVSLTDLYRFPTIAGLASHLDGGGSAKADAEASQARGDKRREAMQRRRRGRKRS